MEDRLREFGYEIQCLIRKKDLSRNETKEMFSRILFNQYPDFQQGAFLAALASKGETCEEIAGCWEAIYELDTAKVSPEIAQPLVENCGTGMDELKTFNISTASSIIAAANGIYLAKHGARAITSRCGAVDILERLGINVDCGVEVVKKSIENCGIGLFNGTSPKIHPKLERILSQIRFGSIINIVASLANPAFPQYGVRGVYSKDKVRLVAEVMKEIGYKRALVVCGFDSKDEMCMDELSTLGKNFVCELSKNGKINCYEFYPEDIGLDRGKYEEIYPEEINKETKNFIRLISGNLKNSRYEIVCLNAAAIFYIMNKVKDLKEGVNVAKEVIESGRAIEKLIQWKECQR